MTYPQSSQPGPRPFPPPGGHRPTPPPLTPPPLARESEWDEEDTGQRSAADGTGHPAVDAVLRALENAARLAPADQIAEYEAAHRVLQETLSSIDG